jgi:hypothetical protein
MITSGGAGILRSRTAAEVVDQDDDASPSPPAVLVHHVVLHRCNSRMRVNGHEHRP